MKIDLQRALPLLLLAGAFLAFAAHSGHASDKKDAGEDCSSDDECKGHCYERKTDGKHVCVDCSPDKISEMRAKVAKYCKDAREYPRKCDDGTFKNDQEAPEDFFNKRIENNKTCIDVRTEENEKCWDGGDDDHKQQVEDAERSKKNCSDELNTRKGNGMIYSCSDSTWESQTRNLEEKCEAYDKGCEEWKKDDEAVDCGHIEEARDKTNKCVEAVEKLDSDCLPRLGSRRERTFNLAKKAYDYCREVLEYKHSNSLCK